MESTELLEKLINVDPVTDPEKFYSLLWKRINFLSSQDSERLIKMSAAASSTSSLHLAHHSFAEGMTSVHGSDFSNALVCFEKALEGFSSNNNKGGKMAAYTAMCICYRAKGQLDKAQNVVQEALQFAPAIGSDNIYIFFKGVTYYQAAEVNVEIKNYSTAIEYFNEGMQYSVENPDMYGRMLNGLGVVYMNLERWEDAIRYLEMSLANTLKEGKTMLRAKVLSDMGIYYFRQKQFEESFKYQEESLKLRLEAKLLSPAVTNYIRMADLCLASGKTKDALKYAEIAVEQSEKMKLHIKLYESYEVLSKIYESLGDTENAFLHYKNYIRVKEGVHSQEVIRKIEELKNQYKVESAEQEKEIFRLRNVELKSAMDEIRESFRYAKRIQSAILPPEELINKLIPDSFVLFKPKDIVSGDFYWLEKSNDKILLAAVDCTGHGVPGAMVSMVGYNCLNKTVHEFGLTQPSLILNKLTELVEETFVHKDFHYENSENEIKDGMDISLCSIDLKKMKMEWAGANNPIWIIRKNEFIEIAADKQPVGKYDHRQPFTNHKLDLLPGDSIYLFTDGYADQFGGPAGKKFKYKQLKELLIFTDTLTKKEQQTILHDRFEDWRGNLEQIDDVLLMGFKMP
jgi:tetratricopeptide (TPR) repeat protein